ncbi:MAG: hypothetical protein JOZ69_09480 [Myxococcales bacterium]|nr:hypothetical protein [Myxococcales bacterium]
MASAGECGGNTACDDFGKVYVRRRLLGTVPILADGSAHFRVPGGLPLVIHLPDDPDPALAKLPRWQREEMTFVPGEHANQSFPRVFFDHLCGGCHGPVSGKPIDAALAPDFLTQASQVAAATQLAADFTGPPAGRAGPIGPPPPAP